MTRDIALITGASRGIGAATALLASARGYRVCINYINNTDAADEVLDNIHAEGGEAFAVKADVSREHDVVELFKAIDAQPGVLTALVSNAGILEQQMRVEDMGADRINRILQTNVTSCFLCAREAIKRMSISRGGKGGAIVNVSSGASRLGSPGEYVDYAASKGAVDTLTIGLSKEVAENGIRVNAVRPGFIYTDIHASGGEPDRVDRVKAGVPLQRGGHAEEVAQAIVWLLSDASSYTTGSFIDVTGGK